MKFIECYRPFGQPASAWVEFALNAPKVLVKDESEIDIAGDTYVYGVDFTGDNVMDLAKTLCDAINARPGGSGEGAHAVNPVKKYYGVYYGRRVVLIATNPRDDGAGLTLAIDKVANGGIVVSGSTFTGGADPVDTIPATE